MRGNVLKWFTGKLILKRQKWYHNMFDVKSKKYVASHVLRCTDFFMELPFNSL